MPEVADATQTDQWPEGEAPVDDVKANGGNLDNQDPNAIFNLGLKKKKKKVGFEAEIEQVIDTGDADDGAYPEQSNETEHGGV